LKVVSRTTVSCYKDKSVDVRDVGTRLGVRTVLEGSVRRAGDRIRVAVQLIDVATGCQRWSRPFESCRTDAAALQEDIAHAVADTLRTSP